MWSIPLLNVDSPSLIQCAPKKVVTEKRYILMEICYYDYKLLMINILKRVVSYKKITIICNKEFNVPGGSVLLPFFIVAKLASGIVRATLWLY